MQFDAHSAADVELLAWARFVDGLELEEEDARRLVFAWVRLHRALFRD
jgi:hypothetical protein